MYVGVGMGSVGGGMDTLPKCKLQGGAESGANAWKQGKGSKQRHFLL